jgi:hypothetical protein
MGMHPFRWPSTTPLPALSDHRQSGSTAPRCMACLLGGYSCGRRTMEYAAAARSAVRGPEVYKADGL